MAIVYNYLALSITKGDIGSDKLRAEEKYTFFKYI